MKHAVSWFEIPAGDYDRAKKFYESIFAVSLQPLTVGPGLRMALFPVEKDGVGGSVIHYPDFYRPGTTGPLLYLNGDPDLSVVLGRVEAAGGKVLVPKTQISPEHGFMAVFQDTEGNRIALHSSS